ncbi:type II toxin-antitoxin system YafQ family toxin [Bartonella sp. CB178]|uniref:type II toxin-antitoxin system YafQ family toxin n=1 Tax=Bartonella sp. CB178 TaxID=3112255 RepID=UPI00300E4415
MRKIVYTRSFHRDLKRESKGRYAGVLEKHLLYIVETLAKDKPLEPRFRDHTLTNQWRGCRDCHIKPDLVLIYRKLDTDILELLRIGSHSELRF